MARTKSINPSLIRRLLEKEKVQLIILFLSWRLLLLSVVLLAPGSGYDTSSRLLLETDYPTDPESKAAGEDSTFSTRYSPALKFLRWDAVYFTEQSRRGYVFEQEWAFGPGYPNAVNGVRGLWTLLSGSNGPGASTITMGQQTASIVTTGTILSSIFHLLSVLLIHGLVSDMKPLPSDLGTSVPFAVALLHIINPAGIFLSAPYSEALFALLSIAGYSLYFGGLQSYAQSSVAWADIQIISTGLVLGVATLVRSNGVLNGAIFLYDAINIAIQLLQGQYRTAKLRRLVILCIGGCCIGLGAVIPQFVAYRAYCLSNADTPRLWCDKWPPSIYTWVQDHYWNVGLFRYWNLSNLPLFLLAAPMIFIMIKSSLWAWLNQSNAPQKQQQSPEVFIFLACLRRLALPQGLAAFLAFTTYHVQIINRLSSGYPLWYFWVISQHSSGLKLEYIVRGMMLYALIQAALFASFLPPA